jgi:ankyrin repeat protein
MMSDKKEIKGGEITECLNAGDLSKAELLISTLSDNATLTFIFQQACTTMNLTSIASSILTNPNFDPSSVASQTLTTASKSGNTELLLLLLKDGRFDPSVSENEPLRMACLNGHVDCVSLLLSDSRTNPGARESEALRNACSNGHESIAVKLLAHPKCNPAACGNRALRTASYTRHKDIVALLLKDERVNPPRVSTRTLIELAVYVVLQCISYMLDLGSVFFMCAIGYVMFRNTGARDGGLSAYSVFNRNQERMEGTLTGEDIDGELRRKMY